MNRLALLVHLGLTMAAISGCASKSSPPAVAPGLAPTSLPGKPAVAASTTPVRRAPKDLLQEAAAKPAGSFPGDNWRPLFDGKTLTGWRETDFAGHGEVECESGMIILNQGDPFTGINWTNEMPKTNYEIALEAMRVMGSDFFCGLTVPVGEGFCSLIVGGWGGGLVGISSLDGFDASENETTKFKNFEPAHWYRIRLRVSDVKLEVWIEEEKLIDVVITGKKISVRPGEIEMSKPFGLASWETTGALRSIRMRPVEGPDRKPTARDLLR